MHIVTLITATPFCTCRHKKYLDPELQQRAMEYDGLSKDEAVGRRNVLPLPHWEKRKSLLFRRLAQREVPSGSGLRVLLRVSNPAALLACLLELRAVPCSSTKGVMSSILSCLWRWASMIQHCCLLHLCCTYMFILNHLINIKFIVYPTYDLKKRCAQGTTTDERAEKPAWMLAGEGGGVSQQRAVELQSPPPAPEANGTAEPQARISVNRVLCAEPALLLLSCECEDIGASEEGMVRKLQR